MSSPLVSTAEAVFGDLAAQGVAVHAQETGGSAHVAVGFREDVGDEALLELPVCVFVADAARHHVVNETLELLAQKGQSSSLPTSRRKASRYFSRVFATTASGRAGTGGCLFHLICSR